MREAVYGFEPIKNFTLAHAPMAGRGNNPLYPLGARLLSWLAPDYGSQMVVVPVAEYDGNDIEVEDGIFARSALMKQLIAARRIIEAYKPDRLIVFGGDCSSAQAP